MLRDVVAVRFVRCFVIVVAVTITVSVIAVRHCYCYCFDAVVDVADVAVYEHRALQAT